MATVIFDAVMHHFVGHRPCLEGNPVFFKSLITTSAIHMILIYLALHLGILAPAALVPSEQSRPKW